MKIRYTVSRGILIEIPGEESAAKADNLAAKLKEVFPEDGDVRVARPTKKTELRISGLDGSIRTEEVIAAVAATGDCSENDIRIGEIKKRSPRGLGAVWIQCPTAAAKKLADKGRISIGWVAARVEVLRARPLTCFRCLEKGHTAKNCTSENDRSSRCYNCGGDGHKAKECTAPPKCPVCHDAGKPTNHRFGGRACDPRIRRKRGTKEPEVSVEKRRLPTLEVATIKGNSHQATSDQISQECGREEAMEIAE